MTRLVLLAPAAVLFAAQPASANQCAAMQGQIVTREVPVGCPIVLYKDQVWNPGLPTAWLERAGTSTEVQATVVSTETENVDVYMETIDADCVEFAGYVSRPWDRMTLEYGAVQAGDVIRFLAAYPDVTIVTEGPCPEPTPLDPYGLQCQSPVQDYWACHPEWDPNHDPDEEHGNLGDDTVGCNAGGGLGLAAIALLAGLRRRRATARR